MTDSERPSWHGTMTGYNRHKCRCDDCRDAEHWRKRGQLRRRKAQRVEVDGRMVHPTARHGTLIAYKGYGCRCRECTEVAVQSVNTREQS